MNRALVVVAVLAGCAQGSVDLEADAPAAADARPDSPPDDAMVDARVDAAPDACVPTAELCNGMDEDCDGQMDEGLGLGMPCDGADTDACEEGHIVCGANGLVVCDDTTSSTAETCNGMDDDCANGIDDGYPVGQTCTVGLGACARDGMWVCNQTGTGTDCTATAGQPSAELCGNSTDEDCNGQDAVCPTNDFPAGAIDISAGGTWTANLVAAHDDNWVASTPSLDCGNQGGRDVFYQFTLPAEEVIYYDTFGSDFDTVLRIFAGSCTSIGATMACTDDACGTTRSQSAVSMPAGTYCLVLDQFSSATTAGAATFTFRRGGRPGIPVPSATGATVTGTTTGGTNYSQASCEPNSNQPDVGYFFLTCSGDHTISANTCTGTAFDSILYVRTGSATSTDKACDDDTTGCGSNGFQSRITNATISGANVHWLILDGFGSSGNGSYSLTYTVQ